MSKTKQVLTISLLLLAVGGVAYMCAKSKAKEKAKRKNLPVYIV